MDADELIRRTMVSQINSEVESDDKASERKRLEGLHGQVWSTDELSRDFSVKGFSAPFVVVERKIDGVKGSLEFQHMPRFYFNFQPH